MTESPCVGIDWTDLLPKVAWAEGDELRFLPVPSSVRRHSTIFDPFANISNLGVGFPSILQCLGQSGTIHLPGEGMKAIDDVVVEGLGSIRQELERQAGCEPGHVMVVVPSSLSERRRDRLLSCGEAAGWSRFKLMDAGVATALGYRITHEKPSTVLVYYASYGDCELALVRNARGRSRVLTSQIVPRTSGELLDAMIMEAIVLALRESKIYLGLKQFSSAEWLRFRDIAHAGRKALSRLESTRLSLDKLREGVPDHVEISLEPAAFVDHAQDLFLRTIEAATSLLDQNQIAPEKVDAVLLVGQVATSPLATAFLTSRFPGRTWVPDPSVLARGAITQAASEAGRVPPHRIACESVHAEPPLNFTVTLERPEEGLRSVLASVTASSPSPVDVHAREASPEARARLDVGSLLSPVRRLIEDNRLGDAGQAIRDIQGELTSLQRWIDRLTPTRPRLMIEKAREMIRSGHPQEAVALAHQAYEEAEDDPTVFSGMMMVHCEAALALNDPRDYARAIDVLRCAHAHDRTDKRVHGALAERHYLHAVELRRLNNVSGAYDAVQSALQHDPEHPMANKLLEVLNGK